ncbi:MAG: hypothetical protein H2174_04495 [Vampirovibrio sp.]|nr:hypothetical protein [Vampirovibrio sp.]
MLKTRNDLCFNDIQVHSEALYVEITTEAANKVSKYSSKEYEERAVTQANRIYDAVRLGFEANGFLITDSPYGDWEVFISENHMKLRKKGKVK